MKRTTRWLLGPAAVALALLLGGALVACGSGDGSTAADPDPGAEEALHVEGDEHEVDDGAVDGADTRDEQVIHVEGDGHDLAAHDEVQEITLVALDHFRYDPSQVTVTVGRPVRLTLDNTAGVILHDLTITGLPATDIDSEGGSHEQGQGAADAGQMDMEATLHVAAEPGGTGILEFTPTESGKYTFFCSVPGHQAAGMEGITTVQAE